MTLPPQPRVTGPTVASPCVNICRMNPRRGLCEGCLRTIGEIADWAAMDDAERARVLARVEARRRAEAGSR